MGTFAKPIPVETQIFILARKTLYKCYTWFYRVDGNFLQNPVVTQIFILTGKPPYKVYTGVSRVNGNFCKIQFYRLDVARKTQSKLCTWASVLIPDVVQR